MIENIKDFIEYIKNKNEILEELENLDHELANEKVKNSKLKKQIEELKIAEEQKDNYLDTIKEKNKVIRQLKKEIKELKEEK